MNRITWTHEVVYTVAGKAAYDDISLPLFIQEYLIVMLMGYAEVYGWEKVRAYHLVWLNRWKQVWVTWDDDEEKV